MTGIAGRCPACRGSSLFADEQGHVYCGRLDCPDPLAVDTMLTDPGRSEEFGVLTTSINIGSGETKQVVVTYDDLEEAESMLHILPEGRVARRVRYQALSPWQADGQELRDVMTL